MINADFEWIEEIPLPMFYEGAKFIINENSAVHPNESEFNVINWENSKGCFLFSVVFVGNDSIHIQILKNDLNPRNYMIGEIIEVSKKHSNLLVLSNYWQKYEEI